MLMMVRKTFGAALLIVVSLRSIFKLILAGYFLLELLLNDLTHRWTAEGSSFTQEQEKSNGLIHGKVLRVLVFHVLYILGLFNMHQFL